MRRKEATAIAAVLGIGAILLVTGMGIKMAFAQANLAAPGQTKENPSLGFPPPGQVSGPMGGGNSGQCIKAGFPKGKVLGTDCMPK